MAELILKDCKMYVAGYDLSGDMNSMGLKYNAGLQDKTVFGSGTRRRLGGLKDVEITGGGFWNATTDNDVVDPVIFNRIGSTEDVNSLIPEGTGIGNVAYFTQGLNAEYTPSGNIGEMLAFSMTAHGNKPLVRGRLMEAGTISTGLTPTVQTLGVRKPKQKLCVGVHVLSVSSSDAGITLHVETDNTTDFSGSPSTALTVTLSDTDANVGRWDSTASSTGDDNYRVSITQTTTGDSVNAVVVLGNA